MYTHTHTHTHTQQQQQQQLIHVGVAPMDHHIKLSIHTTPTHTHTSPPDLGHNQTSFRTIALLGNTITLSDLGPLLDVVNFMCIHESFSLDS